MHAKIFFKLTLGEWPLGWKRGEWTPAFKKGDPHEKGNGKREKFLKREKGTVTQQTTQLWF